MTDKGYDDQFNDGIFRATINNSKLSRPNKWPKSVSEMRGYTSYVGQGMNQSNDVDHSKYQMPRPSIPYIGCVPGPYGECQPGRAPYKMFNFGERKGQWAFDGDRKGWVWVDKKR